MKALVAGVWAVAAVAVGREEAVMVVVVLVKEVEVAMARGMGVADAMEGVEEAEGAVVEGKLVVAVKAVVTTEATVEGAVEELEEV